MKRLVPILILFACALPARAAITATAYVSGGVNNGSTATMVTSAYNQAAHHCIVVGGNAFQQGMTISDTAGDTFTAVVAAYTGGNSNHILGAIAYNTAGNASNVVTLNTTGSNFQFGTVQVYDVNPGSGNCTSALLDVHAAIATTSSGTSAAQTITTAVANEAILTFVYSSGSASFSAATVPTSFTANPSGIEAQYGYSASRIVSAIQTGVTLTWSSLSPTTTYDMFTISIEAIATAACVPSVSITGAGSC